MKTNNITSILVMLQTERPKVWILGCVFYEMRLEKRQITAGYKSYVISAIHAPRAFGMVLCVRCE